MKQNKSFLSPLKGQLTFEKLHDQHYDQNIILITFKGDYV